MTWELAAIGLDLAAVIGCTWHVLLNKRGPAAVLWIVLLLAVPLIGAGTYIAFGVNRLGRRATWKELRNLDLRDELPPLVPKSGPFRELPAEASPLPSSLDPFAMTLANLGRYRSVGGNSIEAFVGGDAWYPAVLEAIDGAHTIVLLQSYIVEADGAGTTVLRALGRAAARGVRCYLLVDAIGSWTLDSVAVRTAEEAGVKVSTFGDRDWLRGRFQINLRNHRKMLVIDGKLAFVGGMNITDDHVDLPGRGVLARDHQFGLRGPVVAQLTAAFAEDWYHARDEKLVAPELFSASEPAGDAVCRVLPSGPDGDHEVFHSVMLAALHAAGTSIRLATPYFLPDEAIAAALRLAALRGVRVQVLIPERPDHRFVGWAMGAYIGPQLKAGVRVYRARAPFLHSKLLVIDDAWALVGSGNVDARSFWLNYELELGIAGREAVAVVAEAFDAERVRARPLDLRSWQARGNAVRAWENFWALWSPML